MKCAKCGKGFKKGNMPNGCPNGVGFVLEDGRQIDLCYSCIVKLGMIKDEKKKDEFFKELLKED
jgi:hypothetical protein